MGIGDMYLSEVGNIHLSKEELKMIYDKQNMLKGNINRMCLSKNYESLDIECMQAKDKIDDIYKILRKHLEDEHDKELKELIE